MTKKFELDERIVDVLESFGWNILGASEYDDGDICVELEWYSDKGEDFVVDFWFDGTVQSFANIFNEYYEQFDPEQHAVDWFGANKGEPPSLRALLADADSIDEHLKETSDTLAQIDDDD